MAQAPWYQTLFGEEYLRLWEPALPPERTAREVEQIVELLEMRDGSRILDLCCGQGRHAIPLAQRGYRVTGLDLSPTLLDKARDRAAAAGVEVNWLPGDMRELRFAEEFDAVINIFTAFGYFKTEAEDLRVLHGVRRALMPAGRFLLETLHRDSLLRRFQPAGARRLEDGVLAVEERSLDLLRSRSETLLTAIYPDGRRSEYRFSVRMYTLAEFARLFAAASLQLEAFYGGLDGSPLTLDSWRLALVGKREG